MAKQKIVIKVIMADWKRQSKAIQIAARLHGVISISIDGDNIVVVGDEIDAITLTVMLRKKMCYAELVTVMSAEEKKEEKKQEGDKSVHPMIWSYQAPMAVPHQYIYETRDPYNGDSCSIM